MSWTLNADARRPVEALDREIALTQARQILSRAGIKADIVMRTPTWKPGDVVVIRFNGPTSTPFTYVRGMKGWPGERVPLTDADVTRHYLAGQVTPVLAAGGAKFPATRLP